MPADVLFFIASFIGWVQGQEIEAHLNFDTRLDLLPFERRDALLQELTIQFEPDSRNMTTLLSAQQIAGPANFQIAHGDFKTATEGGVLFDRAQALAHIRQ